MGASARSSRLASARATDRSPKSRSLRRSQSFFCWPVVRVSSAAARFARREGEDKTLAPVMVGSHLDTQPTGGRYDGVLGVLSGLEIIRTLNDFGIKTRHPIEVVNWTNEEGTRYAPAIADCSMMKRG